MYAGAYYVASYYPATVIPETPRVITPQTPPIFLQADASDTLATIELGVEESIVILE